MTSSVDIPINLALIEHLVYAMAWCMILTGLVVFFILLFMPAPYGKHAGSVSSTSTAPHQRVMAMLGRYTMHPRIGWFFQESPAFFTPVLLLAALLTVDLATPQPDAVPSSMVNAKKELDANDLDWDRDEASLSDPSKLQEDNPVRTSASLFQSWLATRPRQLLVLLFFIIHYLHRVFIYPMRIHQTAAPMPIYLVLFAFTFCTFNGLLQSLSLVFTVPTASCDSCLVLGLAVAALGLGLNIQADNTLMRLRDEAAAKKRDSEKEREGVKNKEKSAVTSTGTASATFVSSKTHYIVPRGGLFELVSCANYAAESLEWLGYSIASQMAFPQVAFFLFTLANLVPRAISHHQWYRSTFGNSYPPRRKAIIPFLL